MVIVDVGHMTGELSCFFVLNNASLKKNARNASRRVETEEFLELVVDFSYLPS